MNVNPGLPRKVLVIHGVQIGEDEDQHQDEQIQRNIEGRLAGVPLEFESELYTYEDLNDEAQRKWKRLLKILVSGPVGVVAEKALDLVGDVVTAKLDTSTAHKIRQGLRQRILDIYEEGNPCYLVAHSLGSIYAFDVVNELIREKELFKRTSRKSWPIQGLVTLGSPIGVSLFRKGRTRVAKLGDGTKWFRWINYWDRTDPVVSGAIFGKQVSGYDIAEKYRKEDPKQGWIIRDKPLDTGRTWLLSHVAYWDHPVVGDGLADLIAN